MLLDEIITKQRRDKARMREAGWACPRTRTKMTRRMKYDVCDMRREALVGKRGGD